MPKIIKNLKETIFDVSTELFLDHGYDNVDMKMIANNCNIAVGTLYNYYKNKKELYMSIIEESWNKTFLKLKDLSSLNITQKEKIAMVISIIYKDIEKRRGIGKELLNNSITELSKDQRLKDFHIKLISNVENIIKPLEKIDAFKNDKIIDRKISEILLASSVILIQSHFNQKDDNIKFLNTLLDSFIK